MVDSVKPQWDASSAWGVVFISCENLCLEEKFCMVDSLKKEKKKSALKPVLLGSMKCGRLLWVEPQDTLKNKDPKKAKEVGHFSFKQPFWWERMFASNLECCENSQSEASVACQHKILRACLSWLEWQVSLTTKVCHFDWKWPLWGYFDKNVRLVAFSVMLENSSREASMTFGRQIYHDLLHNI